jgi:SpoIIAA-like
MMDLCQDVDDVSCAGTIAAGLEEDPMIHFELLRDRKILVITPEGPLEEADFERLAKEVDPFIASSGKLRGVMVYARSFPGWESFGAFVSHLKFVANHHRKIERIAAVSDSGFLKIMPRIADHFVQAEIKHFDVAQKDQALAWLETGQ